MIIDAKDTIIGRVATRAAKKCLLGEDVHILNCKDAVVTGKKKVTLAKYRKRRARGVQYKGPHYPKQPQRIVKRMIKGMVPDNARGREALQRVKCYDGIPYDLRDEEIGRAHV